MLKIIEIKLLVKDLGSINNKNNINRMSDHCKVGRIKSWVNSQAKLSKFKNMVRFHFLT